MLEADTPGQIQVDTSSQYKIYPAEILEALDISLSDKYQTLSRKQSQALVIIFTTHAGAEIFQTGDETFTVMNNDFIRGTTIIMTLGNKILERKKALSLNIYSDRNEDDYQLDLQIDIKKDQVHMQRYEDHTLGKLYNSWLKKYESEVKRDLILLESITPRELEVCRLLFTEPGIVNKQIALKLGIDDQTVKNHITALMRKLSVSTRSGILGKMIELEGI